MPLSKNTVLKIPMAASGGSYHAIQIPDAVSDTDIDDSIITMNTTPRKCLEFQTPLQAFMKELGTDIKLCFK